MVYFIKVHFTVLTLRACKALELPRHVAQESRPFFTGPGRRAATAAAGTAPAIVRGVRRATTCQRVTVRRPSRSGRGTTPSAGCWRCVDGLSLSQICCPKVGGIASDAWNQLSIRVSNGRTLTKKFTPIVRESESLLKIFIDSSSVNLTPKSGEEWQQKLACTAIAQFNRNNAFEIKYEI